MKQMDSIVPGKELDEIKEMDDEAFKVAAMNTNLERISHVLFA